VDRFDAAVDVAQFRRGVPAGAAAVGDEMP
jgi:hypothetical protein